MHTDAAFPGLLTTSKSTFIVIKMLFFNWRDFECIEGEKVFQSARLSDFPSIFTTVPPVTIEALRKLSSPTS